MNSTNLVPILFSSHQRCDCFFVLFLLLTAILNSLHNVCLFPITNIPCFTAMPPPLCLKNIILFSQFSKSDEWFLTQGRDLFFPSLSFSPLLLDLLSTSVYRLFFGIDRSDLSFFLTQLRTIFFLIVIFNILCII